MTTKICQTCGQSFSYEPVMMDGKEMFSLKRCDPCVEKAKAEQQAKDEAIELNHLLVEWDFLVPPLYRATDPTMLPQEPLSKVMAWKFGPKGLVIHGNTGTGKTRAAALLLKRIHLQDRKTIAAFFGNSFAHECGRRFLHGGGEEWIAELSRFDVLFLDDFGKNKFTERVEAEQFGLIERRISHLRPVILTTNFIGKTLAGKMSEDRAEPLIRRLREFCDDVAFA